MGGKLKVGIFVHGQADLDQKNPECMHNQSMNFLLTKITAFKGNKFRYMVQLYCYIRLVI